MGIQNTLSNKPGSPIAAMTCLMTGAMHKVSALTTLWLLKGTLKSTDFNVWFMNLCMVVGTSAGVILGGVAVVGFAGAGNVVGEKLVLGPKEEKSLWYVQLDTGLIISHVLVDKCRVYGSNDFVFTLLPGGYFCRLLSCSLCAWCLGGMLMTRKLRPGRNKSSMPRFLSGSRPCLR